MTRRTVAFHAAIALATVFVIRVLGDGWSGGFPLSFPDSFSYLTVARHGPFSGRFWFDERPVGYPTFTWLFGRGVRLTVLAQTAFYIASFATLIAVVVRSLRSPVARLLATVLIASVATQPRFALWNTLLLSESLTMATGVFTIAAWWWFATHRDKRSIVLAVLVTSFWMMCRDSSVIPVLCVVVPALLVTFLFARWLPPAVRRRVGVAAGLLIIVCGYVLFAQRVSNRNYYAVMNDVGMRILPDESMTDWYVDHGMPMSDELRALTGANSWDHGSAMLTDPQLESFRDWARNSQFDQSVSFVVNAGFWMDLLNDDLPNLLRMDFESYDGFHVRDRLPTSWFGLTGPRSPAALAWWTAIAAGGVIGALTVRRLRGPGVIVGVGLFATAVEGYITFSADSMEVARHLIGPINRLTVLVMLGGVLAVEGVASVVSARRGTGGDVDQSESAAEPDDKTAELVPAPDEPGVGAVAAPGDAPASAAARVARASRSVQTWARRRWGRMTARVLAPRFAAGALTAIVTVFAAAAVFGNVVRSQNFDPKYMRVLVDRAMRFGGSYFENGIHNKGPLEPFVYEAASWFGGADGSWIVISVFVALAGGLLAVTAARMSRQAGASLVMAAAVGLGAFYHFVLSPADYAGSLYAREMTVTLLVAVVAIAITERFWSTRRRATISAAAVGILAGLAVQTLLSTIFAAAVVLAITFAYRRGACGGLRIRSVAAIAGGAFAAVMVAAPVWYKLTGNFDEFWSGWWTYASYSSSATKRPLFAQLGFGWDQAYAYYHEYPLSFAVIVGMLGVSALLWRDSSHRQRVLRLGAMAWLLTGWLELALSQRYSSHYYTVISVPTWLAFALLVGDLERVLRDGGRRVPQLAAVPVAAAVVFVYVGGPTPLMEGVARASQFTSTSALAERNASYIAPPIQGEEAVLDLVTSDDDALLAWTMEPWIYLDRHRVSATRFIWKSFMVGEIYLAGSGPQYVLPRTWEWFDDDIDEAQPLVYYEELDLPRNPDTPFGEYVDASFTPVYTSTIGVVALRNDTVEQVLDGGVDRAAWQPGNESPGWSTSAGAVTFTPYGGDPATDVLAVTDGWCRRVDGEIDLRQTASPDLDIAFQDGLGGRRIGRVTISQGFATSSSDDSQFDQVDWSWPATPSVRFAVVVGERSAVVIVDDQVVGAVPLDPAAFANGYPEITIAGGATPLTLDQLTTASTGTLGTSGC